MTKLKLGILDQSLLRIGCHQSESFQETMATAQLAEAMGYQRFWLAEHHANSWFAGSNPELLMAHIAAKTERIHIGAGGFMLANYTDYRLAEMILGLHSLLGTRLDVGLGRSAGASRDVGALLMPQTQGLDIGLRAQNIFRFLRARSTTDIPCWLLSSGGSSAKSVAEIGAGLAFAHYMAPASLAATFRSYRSSFQAGLLTKPHVIVSVRVEVSSSRLELRRSLEVSNYFTAMVQGLEAPIPGYPKVEHIRALQRMPASGIIPVIAGAPEQVVARLSAMQEEFGIDEFLIVSYGSDQSAKLKGLEELARANA